MPTQPHRTPPSSIAATFVDRADDGTAVERGEADAALLVARVSGELAGLSLAVLDLQVALGATLAAAAERDSAVMIQAQKLDLVAQWLQDIALFLSKLRHRRIGREPLDFDALADPLALAGVGARLAGRVMAEASDGCELF